MNVALALLERDFPTLCRCSLHEYYCAYECELLTSGPLSEESELY